GRQRANPLAWFLLGGTKPRASSARELKRPFSATICTAPAKNLHGKPPHFRLVRTRGARTPRGLQRTSSQGNSTFAPMARYLSWRSQNPPPSLDTVNTFPTLPVPFPIDAGQFRQPIPVATGALGKQPINDLPTTVRMF